MSPNAAALSTFLLAVALIPSAGAQDLGDSRDRGRGVEVTLQVRLMGEGNFRLPEGGVRVELLDNSHTPMMQAYATAQGDVQFRVTIPRGISANLFRLRVTGEGIEPRTTDAIRVHAMQRTHSETVVVRPRQLSGNSAPSGRATVAAGELAIPQPAAQEFDQGNKAMARQEWELAIEHFRKALEAHPAYAGAYNNMGVALIRSGEPARAREAFERALHLDANLAGASMNLARMAYAGKQFEQARELLQRTVTLEPHNGEALLLLADTQSRTGALEDAVASVALLHGREHERFVNAHLIAAQALERLDKLEEASAEYALYLREAPDGTHAEYVQRALQELAARRRPQNAPQ